MGKQRVKGDIDLIILDWHMPELDGYDFLVTIRGDERYKNIPVMMLTTESHKKNMIDAIRAGATHYLIKPFTHEDLLTKVVQLLKIV